MRTYQYGIIFFLCSLFLTACLKKSTIPKGQDADLPTKQPTAQEKLSAEIKQLQQKKEQRLKRLGDLLSTFLPQEELSMLKEGDANRVYEHIFKELSITKDQFESNPEKVLAKLRATKEEYGPQAKQLAALEKDFAKYMENILVNILNSQLKPPIKTKQGLEDYFKTLAEAKSKSKSKRKKVKLHSPKKEHYRILRTWKSVLSASEQEQEKREALKNLL